MTVPLLWRRAAPLAAVAASFAGLVLNELLIGTELIRCGVVAPTAFFFAYTAGVQLAGRDALIGLVLAAGLTLVDFGAGFDPATTAFFTIVTVGIWGIGRIVRSRGRMADELEARTAELRDARDERARLEVATYRARISGELDELLQRRLGELARMAEEGTGNGHAPDATATLADIERESRRTLEEMRAVVGVLRDDSAEAPTAPQPTLTHLEALLVRAKGGDARLTVEGSPRVLPAAVELSAYRIVEQLLAALDDAPDVACACASATMRSSSPSPVPPAGRSRHRSSACASGRGCSAARSRPPSQGGRAEAVVSLPLLAVV